MDDENTFVVAVKYQTFFYYPLFMAKNLKKWVADF